MFRFKIIPTATPHEHTNAMKLLKCWKLCCKLRIQCSCESKTKWIPGLNGWIINFLFIVTDMYVHVEWRGVDENDVPVQSITSNRFSLRNISIIIISPACIIKRDGKFISIFVQQQQQNREHSFHSEMHLSLVADGSTVGHFDGIRRNGNKVGN